jgi:hypothetical protein
MRPQKSLTSMVGFGLTTRPLSSAKVKINLKHYCFKT